MAQKKLVIQQLRPCSLWLCKNYVHTPSNQRTMTRQSWITYFDTPCICTTVYGSVNADDVTILRMKEKIIKSIHTSPVLNLMFFASLLDCGNDHYSPRTEVCCCGKKYTKKYSGYGPYKRLPWKCCGYQYIDGYLKQCCPYFTVISKKHKCPRSKI